MFINKNIRTALLAISLLVSSAAQSQQLPNVVALFGDSISVGYNSTFPVRGYVGARLYYGRPSIALTNILTESGRTSIVPNLGWSGTASGPSYNPGLANTSNGLDRINSHLSQTRSAYDGKAYYVLIMYGTNDSNYDIPASVTGYNNGLLIDRANAQGFTALVSTIAPCDVCANNVDDINNRIRSNVLSKISSGADAHLVDNHAILRANWVSQYSDPDRLHPNNIGYDVIANNWFDSKLKSLIAKDRIAISPIISLLLDD